MALVDYSAIDSGLGGLPYPGQQRGVDRRLAEAEFRPYIGAALLLLRQYVYSQQANLNQLNRHEAPSPANPLIRRFGRPDR